MITDATFRRRFFIESSAVCRDQGLDLTKDELAALLSLDPDVFERMTSNLDPKIVRALTVAPGGGPRSHAGNGGA
jgi:hypothetical protein